jgi:hypothetical protein
MIRISLVDPNGSSTLIYSGGGSVNLPLTLDALKTSGSHHVGHHLIEVMSESGEMFADIIPDASGLITLYGKTEDIALGPETRRQFGICCHLPRGGDNSSLRPSSITFEFRDRSGKPVVDAAGNPVGPFKFNFNVRQSSVEALFATNTGFDLPEMMCEPRRRALKTFKLTTIQPVTNSVTYSASRSAGNPNFSHVIRLGASGTSTNRFVSPNGPILDIEHFGIARSAVDDHVFFVSAQDAFGNTHAIPFIAYAVDTPAQGELVIDSFESDPAGPDRGKETITLRNASTRLLSLRGCFLEDELLGSIGALPGVAPVRTNLPAVRLAPGDLLVVNPTFELNNDYDAFTLQNRLGSLIALSGYIRRLPGGLPPAQPRLSPILQTTLSVTHVDGAEVKLHLEDGDLVIIQPNPSNQLWAGEIPDPGTGPEGWFDSNGQQVPNFRNWNLWVPSAPVYSLVMTTPNRMLIGNKRRVFVVDRKSPQTNGFRTGRQTLRFDRNDEFNARLLGWGQFDVTVTVMRH